MLKKFHWKIEYSILGLIFFGLLLIVTPFSFESARQANFISKWNEKINRVEYMFSVINAHIRTICS